MDQKQDRALAGIGHSEHGTIYFEAEAFERPHALRQPGRTSKGCHARAQVTISRHIFFSSAFIIEDRRDARFVTDSMAGNDSRTSVWIAGPMGLRVRLRTMNVQILTFEVIDILRMCILEQTKYEPPVRVSLSI
jgi:hypothetical protein